MIEIESTARKWGNSIGFTIPKDIIEAEGIQPKDKVHLIIEKRVKVKDLFGKAKDWKIDTQEIKNKLRKGWD